MRLLLASLAVHDLILFLVQIEQGVQLIQAGGFRCKLFLLGEWLLYLGLCIFKLNPRILQLLDIKSHIKRSQNFKFIVYKLAGGEQFVKTVCGRQVHRG